MKCYNDVAHNLKYISDFKSDAQNLLHSEKDNSLPMKFPSSLSILIKITIYEPH